MDLSKMYLKDTGGHKSLTATAFIVGFIICCFKLLVSGLVFGSFAFEKFSGSDFGIAVGALGAIYTLRNKQTPATEDKNV